MIEQNAKTENSANTNQAPAKRTASVAMGFVTGILAGALRQGRDPAHFLLRAGISPETFGDPRQRIPVDRYAALYNLINRELNDESFGLFAHPMPVGSFELLTRSLAGSPNLDVALERASRFLAILLPDLALKVSSNRDSARLEIRETVPADGDLADPCRVFAFEWLLRLLHGLFSWLVGRGLVLEAVTFPYPRPAHAADYALIYTEHSSFGGDSLVATIQANMLDLPIRRDEAAIEAFLEGAPGKLTTLYRRDREMVLRVRDSLRAALPYSLSLDQVAARLHLSERTLHRRLEEEGSSFRAIKDALRRDMALARLAKSQESIAQIAADLGYADPSAFYRAFVEWTGMAPAHYRKRLLRDA